MDLIPEQSWRAVLQDELNKQYFKDLQKNIPYEYENHTVFPEKSSVFRAFELTPFDSVNVVIIGQDPYHGPRQANGLCFSVSEGIPIPPSLKNIYKEIEADIGNVQHSSGQLEPWAKQGVLLLNSTLTVRSALPGSHRKLGWETFTDAVIQVLNDQKKDLVFMLWGNDAIKKGSKIDTSKQCVLTAAHPSPLSAYRGFFGCKHFSQANEYLALHNKPIIKW